MANFELATFGGGCFWCVEAVMQRVKGVVKQESGYAGGNTDAPTYKDICTGTTGHAEVVQISFDSNIISYRDLLFIFMTTHDPTTLNRQGADHGTQYRSVIFYHSDSQKADIEAILPELENSYGNKIVTEVVPLGNFYIAEDYHQNYYNNNNTAGYCAIVIEPKIQKLRKLYADKLA